MAIVGILLALHALPAGAQVAPQAVTPPGEVPLSTNVETAPASAPAPAAAASEPDAPTALFQPGAWKAGQWSITSQLGLALGYNDNLRSQASAPIKSRFTALLPGITADRPVGDDSYELTWRSDWTRFADSRPDDTFNTELAASGLDVYGEHTAFAWRAGWQDWHDALGLTAPEVVSPTPDHFHAFALGAVWRHDGGDTFQQRIELEPTISDKVYVNHRDTTSQADARTASLVARGLFLADGAHRYGGELRAIRTTYPTDLALISDTELRALATLQVDPSGPFSGNAVVGFEHRNFDRARPSYAGLTWETSAQWQPRADTTLTAGASRAAVEAPGEEVDEAVIRRFTLGATQDWSARWHGTVTASASHDRYVDSPVPRDDDVRTIDLSLRADVSRTWEITLNYGWSHRSSVLTPFDFTRRVSSIVLTAAI